MSGRTYKDLSPAHGAVAVDVSSTDQVLAAGCRALYIGTTGHVVVDMPNATGITFSNVPVGVLNIQVTKVYNSGTTASTIVALY